MITPFKIPAFSPATPPPPKSIVGGGFKIHFIFYIVTFGGARALFSTVPVIVSCFGRFSVFSLSLFFSHPPSLREIWRNNPAFSWRNLAFLPHPDPRSIFLEPSSPLFPRFWNFPRGYIKALDPGKTSPVASPTPIRQHLAPRFTTANRYRRPPSTNNPDKVAAKPMFKNRGRASKKISVKLKNQYFFLRHDFLPAPYGSFPVQSGFHPLRNGGFLLF